MPGKFILYKLWLDTAVSREEAETGAILTMPDGARVFVPGMTKLLAHPLPGYEVQWFQEDEAESIPPEWWDRPEPPR